MSNKKNKQTKEVLADEREQNNQIAYSQYATRTEVRQKAGEEIELKPYESWLRKGKDKEGNEIQIAGDSGETKRARFKRLIEARMTSALHELDLVMNLSSAQYESNTKDHEQIINTLRLKVLDIENSFKVQKVEESLFNLKE